MQARHYLDALDSAPDDDDADDLRRTASDLLERAALRARSLGSAQEALRHYTTALERAPEPEIRARLHEGAARAAKGAARGTPRRSTPSRRASCTRRWASRSTPPACSRSAARR